jgi:predicted ATPase
MSDEKDGSASQTRVHHAASTAYSAHRLIELRVANVKSLAGDHVIPLAPLTLIYGPNAAGKSSIIQSLLLLAQSVHANTFAPRGPLVDLRDYRHLVSGHDTSREVTVGIRFAVEEEDTDAVMFASHEDVPPDVPPIRFEAGAWLTFHDEDNEGAPWVRLALGVEESMLVQPYPTESVEGYDDEGWPYGPYYLAWRLDLRDAGTVETLATTLERAQVLQGTRVRRDDVHNSMALLRFALEVIESGYAASASLEMWADPTEPEEGLRPPRSLRLWLEPRTGPQDGLAPVSAEGRGLSPKDQSDAEDLLKKWASGSTERDVLGARDAFGPVVQLFDRIDEEARALCRSDAMGEDQSPAARRYRERRQFDGGPDPKLVSLGPIRPGPRRVHLEDEIFDPTALALIRRLHSNDKLLAQVNQWLQRLEIPYTVAVDRLVSERKPDTDFGYSFELTDTRTSVEVSLADVGYGVSQVLPIITECVGSSSSTICIEQPELHLHPRLAANLAELLVESTKRGNQIIAETHSENILLRVQRLIRDGVIAASDVAVLYVDSKPDVGAEVTRLPLDDEGDLLVRWPGGFFDDRLADVLGVSS